MPSLFKNASQICDGSHIAPLAKLFSTIPVVLFSFFFTAQSASAQGVAHRYITIGTGTPEGVYYAVGTAICDAVNLQAERRLQAGAKLVNKCFVGLSAGSVFNVRQIGNGAFTFAIAQSNVATLALKADPPDSIAPVPGLRSVMALHNEALQILTPPTAPYNDLSELLDVSVSTGGFGSGSRQLFLQVAEAHGVPLDAIEQIDDLSPAARIAALCDGSLSAMAFVTAVPSAATKMAASDCEAQLLPLNDGVISTLVESTPGLATTRISEDTYPAMVGGVTTVGVRAGLFTRDVVPEFVVKDIVNAVASNIDVLRKSHPSLADLDARSLSPASLGVQLHSGAESAFSDEDFD